MSEPGGFFGLVRLKENPNIYLPKHSFLVDILGFDDNRILGKIPTREITEQLIQYVSGTHIGREIFPQGVDTNKEELKRTYYDKVTRKIPTLNVFEVELPEEYSFYSNWYRQADTIMFYKNLASFCGITETTNLDVLVENYKITKEDFAISLIEALRDDFGVHDENSQGSTSSSRIIKNQPELGIKISSYPMTTTKPVIVDLEYAPSLFVRTREELIISVTSGFVNRFVTTIIIPFGFPLLRVGKKAFMIDDTVRNLIATREITIPMPEINNLLDKEGIPRGTFNTSIDVQPSPVVVPATSTVQPSPPQFSGTGLPIPESVVVLPTPAIQQSPPQFHATGLPIPESVVVPATSTVQPSPPPQLSSPIPDPAAGVGFLIPPTAQEPITTDDVTLMKNIEEQTIKNQKNTNIEIEKANKIRVKAEKILQEAQQQLKDATTESERILAKAKNDAAILEVETSTRIAKQGAIMLQLSNDANARVRQIEEADARISSAKSSVTTEEQRRIQLEETNTRYKDQLNNLESTIKQKEIEVADRLSQRDKLQSSIEGLKTNVEKLTTEQNVKTNELVGLREKTNALTSENITAKKELEEQIRIANGDLATIEESVIESKTTLKRTEQIIISLEGRNDIAKRENQDFEARRLVAQSQLDEIRKETTTVSSKLDSVKQQEVILHARSDEELTRLEGIIRDMENARIVFDQEKSNLNRLNQIKSESLQAFNKVNERRLGTPEHRKNLQASGIDIDDIEIKIEEDNPTVPPPIEIDSNPVDATIPEKQSANPPLPPQQSIIPQKQSIISQKLVVPPPQLPPSVQSSLSRNISKEDDPSSFIPTPLPPIYMSNSRNVPTSKQASPILRPSQPENSSLLAEAPLDGEDEDEPVFTSVVPEPEPVFTSVVPEPEPVVPEPVVPEPNFTPVVLEDEAVVPTPVVLEDEPLLPPPTPIVLEDEAVVPTPVVLEQEPVPTPVVLEDDESTPTGSFIRSGHAISNKNRVRDQKIETDKNRVINQKKEIDRIDRDVRNPLQSIIGDAKQIPSLIKFPQGYIQDLEKRFSEIRRPVPYQQNTRAIADYERDLRALRREYSRTQTKIGGGSIVSSIRDFVEKYIGKPWTIEDDKLNRIRNLTYSYVVLPGKNGKIANLQDYHKPYEMISFKVDENGQTQSINTQSMAGSIQFLILPHAPVRGVTYRRTLPGRKTQKRRRH